MTDFRLNDDIIYRTRGRQKIGQEDDSVQDSWTAEFWTDKSHRKGKKIGQKDERMDMRNNRK
jgi:hypothetical protein